MRQGCEKVETSQLHCNAIYEASIRPSKATASECTSFSRLSLDPVGQERATATMQSRDDLAEPLMKCLDFILAICGYAVSLVR